MKKVMLSKRNGIRRKLIIATAGLYIATFILFGCSMLFGWDKLGFTLGTSLILLWAAPFALDAVIN
jgi:hypothetical protein